jgi:hypothetical protein
MIFHVVYRFVDEWCRAMGRAYVRWEARACPNGDGI